MARNENTESYIVGLTFFATHNSPVTRVVTIDLPERPPGDGSHAGYSVTYTHRR